MYKAYKTLEYPIVIGDTIDLSRVEQLNNIFNGSTNSITLLFNKDLSNIRSMCGLFYKHDLSTDLGSIDVSNVADMTYMFALSRGDVQNLSDWDTSRATNMSFMFYGSTIVDSSIANWDLTSLWSVIGMFANSPITMKHIKDWGWIDKYPDVNWVTAFEHPSKHPIVTSYFPRSMIYTNTKPFTDSIPLGASVNIYPVFKDRTYDTNSYSITRELENILASDTNFNVSKNKLDVVMLDTLMKEGGLLIGNNLHNPKHWDVSNVRDMSFLYNEHMSEEMYNWEFYWDYIKEEVFN